MKIITAKFASNGSSSACNRKEDLKLGLAVLKNSIFAQSAGTDRPE